ncbi:MAG: rod shape-determining protein MreC [Elusimicrobia bacterium RIFOXYC2_FULL_34_12]|nr:MAG: rod shape-determining protein MreC [Elusimicrobia bacterium RIFOXYC2_FULL_34_12]OGS38561.1 MAG: rod shape-determining protein MreC [Elusimicrobia bacterium RIFOXYD2_FULL_34_30]HAM38828.1 rod shape-determining protein MreC [Elusimicrobiota bacterium]
MYKKNPTILLSFYLIISILILSFNVNPSIKAARDFLFYVIISPYSKIDSAIFSVNRFGNNIKELVDAHQQILDLKNENKQLLTDLLKLKILEVENKRLTEILNYKKNLKRKINIARIIAKPSQQYYKSLIIDKGIDDNLKENRAVYGYYKNHFGIIGQLIDVSKNTSQVLLITNRISKIPGRIIPAGVDGIILGNETNELEMAWIPIDAEIKIGDEVVSSSASDIFPSGIPIGIIVSISQSGHLPFKSAQVKPTIPAFQLTDVFIE